MSVGLSNTTVIHYPWYATALVDGRKLKAREASLKQLNGELEQRVEQRTAELSDAVTRVEDSERKLSAIMEHTSLLIGLCSSDGKILRANRAVQNNVGLDESAFVGRYLWDSPDWPTDDVRHKVREAVREASGGRFSRQELLHRRPDGSTGILDFSISPILDAAGDVVMLVPEGRDIDDLKQVEQQLRDAMAQAESADASNRHSWRQCRTSCALH